MPISASPSRNLNFLVEPNSESAFLGVSLSLSPPFPDASRPDDLRDQYALLSLLSWSAMRPVIEEIGWGAVLEFPELEEIAKSLAQGPPCVPERWTAVIPEHRRDLAELCIQQAKTAKEGLRIAAELEVRAIVTPWSECSPAVVQKLLGTAAPPGLAWDPESGSGSALGSDSDAARDALFEARLAVSSRSLDAKHAFRPIPAALSPANETPPRDSPSPAARIGGGWSSPAPCAILTMGPNRAPFGPRARLAFAAAQAEFAIRRAPAIIERHGGLTIRSCADETIAALPAASALACSSDLARSWGEVMRDAQDSGEWRVSLSGGLVIIDHPSFARLGLQRSRTACRIAKDHGGDRLRVSFHPGSLIAVQEEFAEDEEPSSALISWDAISELLELARKAARSSGGEHQTFALRQEAAVASSLPWPAAIAEINRLAFGAWSLEPQAALTSFFQSLRRDRPNRRIAGAPAAESESPPDAWTRVEDFETDRLALAEGMQLLILAIYAQRLPGSPRRLRA